MSRSRPAILLLSIAAKIKPFLVRFFPIEFLRKVKRKLVYSAMPQIGDISMRPFNRQSNKDGINLIGDIKGKVGLAQSSRLVAKSISETGIAFTLYNYTPLNAAHHNDSSWDEKISTATPYNMNILHINAYDLAIAAMELDCSIWDQRYNIAFWLWELEQFPDEWQSVFKLVDEIWTPSEFASESIRKATDKPVRTIPYAISAPTDERYGREYFGLPKDKFLFLCMFDCSSNMERKNPMGTVRAYKLAFSPNNQNVGLVLKVNNPQKKDLASIENELAGYSNIHIIAEVLEKVQVNSLIACTDVLVSMHRAEGFGLVPAEAMLLGTPVIATNWSSNTEFMNQDVACMVDYSLITIEKDCEPYKKGNRWADPNLEQAAGFMKCLSTDKDFYSALSEKAKKHIKCTLSPERATKLISQRIQEIYEQYG